MGFVAHYIRLPGWLIGRGLINCEFNVTCCAWQIPPPRPVPAACAYVNSASPSSTLASTPHVHSSSPAFLLSVPCLVPLTLLGSLHLQSHTPSSLTHLSTPCPLSLGKKDRTNPLSDASIFFWLALPALLPCGGSCSFLCSDRKRQLTPFNKYASSIFWSLDSFHHSSLSTPPDLVLHYITPLLTPFASWLSSYPAAIPPLHAATTSLILDPA